MNDERKMYAEIILKEVERIGEIKREGIIIHCNEDEIAKFLNVRDTMGEDLIKLRNLLVERLTDRIEVIGHLIETRGFNKQADYNEIEQQHAIMTVVTGIIDKEYYNR